MGVVWGNRSYCGLLKKEVLDVALLGDYRVHDSSILDIKFPIKGNMIVNLKTIDGEYLNIHLYTVKEYNQFKAVGMFLYSITEEQSDNGQKIIEFVNWYDKSEAKGDAYLKVVCESAVISEVRE